MDDEVMLDASEWTGFRRLTELGWRVSVSARLLDRYVRLPDQADVEYEDVRYRTLLARLLRALRAMRRLQPDPYFGFGFRINALPNDPDRVGDATLATIEVEVFPTIDRQRRPRLMVCLTKETLPALPGRMSLRH